MTGGFAQMEKLYVSIQGDMSHLQNTYKNATFATRNLAKQVETAGVSMNASFASVGHGLKDLSHGLIMIGGALSAAITAPILKVGKESVHAFAEFDLAMTKTTSIMENTEAQTKAMRDAAIEMSQKGARSAHDIGEAMYFLAAAGMKAESVIATMPVVLNFATAGAFDLHTASRLATTSVMALGMASHDATEYMHNMQRVTDVVVRVSKMAEASTESFARALTRDAAAVMQQYGISVEEGVAVLGAYARQNIVAENAGNMFGRMVRLVTSAATKHADAFEKMGISVFDTQGKFRGVANVIEDLEKALSALSAEEKVKALDRLGFKVLSQKAILPLIGQSKQIREFNEQLDKAGGTADKIAGRQIKAFSNQMAILKNQITAAAIEIGEILAPAIKEVGAVIKGAIDWWKALNPEVKRTIMVIAALAAAIGPVILAIGAAVGMAALAIMAVTTVVEAVGAIAGVVAGLSLGPVLLGIAAAAALIAAPIIVATLAVWGFVKSAGGWAQAWEKVKGDAQAFIDWIRPIWDATTDLLMEFWPLLEELAVGTWEAIESAFTTVFDLFRWNLGMMMGDSEMTWTQIRDTIVGALEFCTFAVSHFEEVSTLAATNVLKSFIDMADAMTFGLASALDELTLGIGESFKEQREAVDKNFEEWKRARQKTEEEGKKTAEAVAKQLHPHAEKVAAMGKQTGKEFKRGLLGELEKIDAKAVESAEGLFAVAAYRQRLRDFDPEKAAKAGVTPTPVAKPNLPADMGDKKAIGLLEDIRDAVQSKDHLGIDIDTADLDG